MGVNLDHFIVFGGLTCVQNAANSPLALYNEDEDDEGDHHMKAGSLI